MTIKNDLTRVPRRDEMPAALQSMLAELRELNAARAQGDLSPSDLLKDSADHVEGDKPRRANYKDNDAGRGRYDHDMGTWRVLLSNYDEVARADGMTDEQAAKIVAEEPHLIGAWVRLFYALLAARQRRVAHAFYAAGVAEKERRAALTALQRAIEDRKRERWWDDVYADLLKRAAKKKNAKPRKAERPLSVRLRQVQRNLKRCTDSLARHQANIAHTEALLAKAEAAYKDLPNRGGRSLTAEEEAMVIAHGVHWITNTMAFAPMRIWHARDEARQLEPKIEHWTAELARLEAEKG